MRRIAVIGAGGAGKSTLARRLGAVLGIEVTHLDTLFWRPGWVETPRPEWEETMRRLVARDAWILDGNYGGTLELRLARADTVIFMDPPRLVSIWGAVWRRIRFAGRARPDMAPGCPERLTWEFLTWIWSYQATRRPEILRRLDALNGTRVVRLRSRAEAKRFLRWTARRYGREPSVSAPAIAARPISHSSGSPR